MKSKKIICIVLIIFSIFFINKQAYAVQDNEINNDVNQEEGINRNNMEIELTGVEAGKNCENKEVMIDVNINNAIYVNSGTIQIEYDSDLKFVNIENENGDYSIEAVNNEEESILVLAFTSNEGQTGDFRICSLKFKLPQTIKEEKYYKLSFGEETKLITTQVFGNKYKLFPATIHCEKSEKSTVIKYILIAVGVVILIVIIIILMKDKKRVI